MAKEQKASFSVATEREKPRLFVFSRASLHNVAGLYQVGGPAPRFSGSLLVFVPIDSAESVKVVKKIKNAVFRRIYFSVKIQDSTQDN